MTVTLIGAPIRTPVVGVVSNGDDDSLVRQRIFASIAKAGAALELWQDASAIARAPVVSAVVLDLGENLEDLLPVAAALECDPRMRTVPRIVVVAPDVPAARLAPFGSVTVVSSASPLHALGSAIAIALEHTLSQNDSLRTNRDAGVALRTLEETLEDIQREAITLSHDARVLFGVILGFAANLRDGLAGPVTPEQHRQLLSIVDASNDAASLLDRYVSRLQRTVPRATDPPRSVVPRVAARRQNELGELVRVTLALFDGAATTKGIELATDITTPTFCWCDAMQIKQALVNLVSNALKFTPNGGRITLGVRAGATTGEPFDPGVGSRRAVELFVSDTGPGIPEHARERVFERGVRLDRDQATPGSGLGLSTVRNIAVLHGGSVRAEETPGGGTTVVLTLPIDRRTRSSGDFAAIQSPSAPPRSYPSSTTTHGASAPPSSASLSELRRDPE